MSNFGVKELDLNPVLALKVSFTQSHTQSDGCIGGNSGFNNLRIDPPIFELAAVKDYVLPPEPQLPCICSCVDRICTYFQI